MPKNSKSESPYRITVDKLYTDAGSLKAGVSMQFGDFVVHGIKVYESRQGLFVGMPTKTHINSLGEASYSDVFHPVTALARHQMVEDVLSAYRLKLEQEMGEEEEELPFRDRKPELAMSL
ncbi:MAG: SpoVG family protein [Clostridia bacterium]|jgi:DNA-binding cell septation regulator SpoVG|nr:SpoVG family protein [Clostridia bacterium]MBQ3927456.1 SpoVG family protein [Clostridia bacterium]